MDNTEPSNECSICWADLSEDPAPLPPVYDMKKPKLRESNNNNNEAKLSSTPCGHIFHTDCLINWIDKKRQERALTTCPTCRKKVTKTQLRPLYLDVQASANKQGGVDAKCVELETLQTKFDKLTEDYKNLEANSKCVEYEELKLKFDTLVKDCNSLETKNQKLSQELNLYQTKQPEPNAAVPDISQGDPGMNMVTNNATIPPSVMCQGYSMVPAQMVRDLQDVVANLRQENDSLNEEVKRKDKQIEDLRSAFQKRIDQLTTHNSLM